MTSTITHKSNTQEPYQFNSGRGYMPVTQMKIKEENPPNFIEIIRVFGDLSKKKPCFCYGDVIYNPYRVEITPDLEIHEDTHRIQQGNLPDIWWEQYLSDTNFRLSQEIEAYAKQYQFACKLVDEIRGGAKMKKAILESIAKSLSGEMYGSIITYSQAETAIRKYYDEKKQPK